MIAPLLLLVVVVLGGLVFMIFAGVRRRNSRGEVTARAPGSTESPVFGKPERAGAGTKNE